MKIEAQCLDPTEYHSQFSFFTKHLCTSACKILFNPNTCFIRFRHCNVLPFGSHSAAKDAKYNQSMHAKVKKKKERKRISTHHTVICFQLSQGHFFLDFTPFHSSISKDQSETDNLLLVFSDLLLWFSPAGVPAPSPGRARMMQSGRGTRGRQKAWATPPAPPLSASRGRRSEASWWVWSDRRVSPACCSRSRIHCPQGAGIWR